MRSDVVITGLGATTPLGGDVARTWEGLVAGRSGVRTTEWDLPVRMAALLTDDPAEILGRPLARRLDRCEQVALVAAREAWADAGAPEVDPVRLAVVIGTGTGGALSMLGQDDILERDGVRRVSPHTVPMLMANGPAAWVSIELGAEGGAHAPVSACASGSEAIALGLDLIRLGRADVVVAGGAEACVHPLTLAGFSQARTLSRRNDEPERASRPFDVARDGFVMGEGAGLVVLERAEFAAARGARVLARLAGAGITSNAVHITASGLDGQSRAVAIALREADISPEDVGHVSAHATSTPEGDVVEAQAIVKSIGAHPPVTAIKSMLGHLCGAAGGVAAVAVVRSLMDGRIPATLNLDSQDPAIELDVVTGSPRPLPEGAVIVNAFGFGGHNVTLVLSR
ncbi:beta-ketoacyl-[acyl-carrier-protein] synthase family protein [Nonomuraea dietziae]|uniref:beta-ketoacyl-[acyl-carrier-protein] synthase family protein n=1 Tax=Nonomuraea dietziae TaxID=65515 RepID=UPI003406DD78